MRMATRSCPGISESPAIAADAALATNEKQAAARRSRVHVRRRRDEVEIVVSPVPSWTAAVPQLCSPHYRPANRLKKPSMRSVRPLTKTRAHAPGVPGTWALAPSWSLLDGKRERLDVDQERAD